MTKQQRKQRDDFYRALYEHGKFGDDEPLLRQVEIVAPLLMRDGAAYKRLKEIWATGNPPNVPDAIKHENQIAARLRKRAAIFGCGVLYSGDPRGCTVKLMMPDGYTDDFGNTGVCVPGA